MGAEPRHVHPYFAGVGSRETPVDVCEVLARIARLFAKRGVGLRSGGAEGADEAFESGATLRKQIFLPWRGFNGHPSRWAPPRPAALREAALHHPKWSRCSESHRLLHGRNSHIVLGPELNDPCVALVCWTVGGRGGGGTGQAIRTANAWRIPVMDIYHDEAVERLRRYLKGPPIPGGNYGARL